jgi:hypothetical protein
MFIEQLTIYLKMIRNYNKFCTNKTVHFYIYTMPILGFFISLFVKFILSIKNRYLISNILKYKIFLSSIRYLNIRDRLLISKTLERYNNIGSINIDNWTPKRKKQLIDLQTNGFCKLGKIFKNDECKMFIQSLVGTVSYDSQVILQSSGVKKIFDPNSRDFLKKNNAYTCFEPQVFNDFKPIANMLENQELMELIKIYLNFNAEAYSCHNWYNPKSETEHYVHRLHRDNQDFKFLTMVIYWNEVTRDNGATFYIKGSHKSDNKNLEGGFLEGLSGEAFLADFSGLHKGTSVKKNFRYTTFVNFGNPFNYASVIDGYLHKI